MTNRYGWNVAIRWDEAIDGLKVWLINTRPDGSREIVHPIDITYTREYLPYECFPEPTFHFNGDEGRQILQGFAEGLVQNGFKPDELKASDKELAAVRYHLEDMRGIALKEKLPIEQSR